MISLREALAGVALLAVDTAPVIYFVEAHPKYDVAVTYLFDMVSRGSLVCVTSVITLGEVLVQPYAHGDQRLQEEYRDLLLRSEHLRTTPIDSSCADLAARLRARYRLRTPDALQVAVAVHAGAEAFLTNDRGLQRVTEVRVIVLDDFVV